LPVVLILQWYITLDSVSRALYDGFMSSLSNPTPVAKDDPIRVINIQKYSNNKTVGRFVIKGEDAYWLERLAREQGMTVDALVKIFVIEGLYRRRSYLNLG